MGFRNLQKNNLLTVVQTVVEYNSEDLCFWPYDPLCDPDTEWYNGKAILDKYVFELYDLLVESLDAGMQHSQNYSSSRDDLLFLY